MYRSKEEMTKEIEAQWNSKRKRDENGMGKKEYIERREGEPAI